jgi:hypothetical protein
MKTKAEVFQELIEKVLGLKCELAIKEDMKSDIQRENQRKQGKEKRERGIY